MQPVTIRSIWGPHRSGRSVFRKSLWTIIDVEVYQRKTGWITRLSRAIDKRCPLRS